MNGEEIVLVYDGECPACHAYSQIVRIRQSVGKLRLVDARESSDLLEAITALGMDMNQGMILKVGDRWLQGSEAIHALSLMSSRSGVLNRLNYWIFRSRTASRLLYPVLRGVRSLLLILLGRTKLNNLKPPSSGEADLG